VKSLLKPVYHTGRIHPHDFSKHMNKKCEEIWSVYLPFDGLDESFCPDYPQPGQILDNSMLLALDLSVLY